jgi:hypothetical protein
MATGKISAVREQGNLRRRAIDLLREKVRPNCRFTAQRPAKGAVAA